MTDPTLDNLIWSALAGEQACFALGTDRARRFHPEIGPLAAIRDTSPESLADLAGLVRESGELGILTQGQAPDVPEVERVHQGAILRMIYQGAPVATSEDPALVPLDASDYPQMLELAKLTEPGPFSTRTGDLGSFWGVRDEPDRLLAMGGQRLRTERYIEVSGICTRPETRGRGLARALTKRVMAAIQSEGRTPVLHCYAHNTLAITLYERLGFVEERRLTLTVFAPRA